MDAGIYAAAGALLVAVLNELRARSRARVAQLERQELGDELRVQAERTRRAVAEAPAVGEGPA